MEPKAWWMTQKPKNTKSKKPELSQTATETKPKSTSEKTSFNCFECLEKDLSEGTRTRHPNLCRADSSSVIKRHKENHHKQPGQSASCHILPSDSVEIKNLKRKYQRQKETEKTVENKSNAPIDLVSIDDIEISPPPSKKQKISPKESQKEKPQVSKNVPASSTTTQSTLISFCEKPKEEEEEPSLKLIMDTLKGLQLDMTKQNKHFAEVCKVAFCDTDTNRVLNGMRQSENILEMTDACNHLEWYYNETTEEAVLRCKACFFVQKTAKPSLKKLSPYEAQKLLNKETITGSFSTGLFYTADKSKQLIEGHNTYWSRQKFSIIEHMSMIGKGAAVHKKAMEELKKHETNLKTEQDAIKNVFRAAVGVLKLKAAATNLESMLSLLATCGVKIGNIGHGRKNFNDIIYCLEKAIDEKTNKWLNSPLPSTGLPPHFWSTVDKATPSRETNQAVIIVARDERGNVCPIPVAAPTVYEELEAASYYHLATQMTNAIKEKFSPEVLSRYIYIVYSFYGRQVIRNVHLANA